MSPAWRWLLLPAAVVGGSVCVLRGPTAGRLAFTLVSGAGWYALSRRKVLSLDRENLGVPPRRR